ncbi:hypothetical protein [Pseudarthrobacter sp. NS4]|uniref:hypothetical protein n=1 Tax=Pseudarthrobacter sp. NS4 TaxID=2973976 RepID=UPI0021618B68|nr:hypothetical protein [Pseudarthrobacter sp. NS4]
MGTRPDGVTPIINQGLARYTGALFVGVLVVQGYTAFVADGRVTAGTALLLAAVALYMVVFTVRYGTALRQRAYGAYFAHAVAYLIINGSFWVHAWILMLSGRDEILQQGWSGPLVSMSVLWGAGLLVHTIGAMLSRGYEHVEV